MLTAFPGTPLYQRLKLEDRLLSPEDWESCTLFDVNFLPKHMSPDELRKGLYWLSEQLYSRAGVKARRRVFFEQAKGASGSFGLDMTPGEARA